MAALVEAQSAQGDDAALIDFRQIGAVIRRRWLVILVIWLAVIVVTTVTYLGAERIYTATAQVGFNKQQIELAATGKQDTNDGAVTDSPFVDTQVQILSSPAMASLIVDRLKLDRDPEFAGLVADGSAAAKRRAIVHLTGKRLIRRVGTSYVIGVSADASTGDKAAAIARTTVDTYVSSQLGGMEGGRTREIKLLSQRLGTLQSQLAAAEEAVARYKATNGLVDVRNDSTLSAAETTALNSQLASAQAEAAAANARATSAGGQLSKNAGGSVLDATLNSTVISQFRNEQAQLATQRADLAGRYGAQHPDLARIDSQMREIDKAIRSEVRRVVSGLDTEARVANDRVASLKSAINRSQGDLVAQNNASPHLAELQRSADSTRVLYQAFLDNYRGALARQGTDQPSAFVVSTPAGPGSLTSPNLLIYILLAVVAGLLASVVIVTVLQFLEDGVEAATTMPRLLGLDALGTIPDLTTVPGAGIRRSDQVAPADYLVEHPSSLFAEAFRGLRTALQRGSNELSVKVVAVTSSVPNEGKTTTAVCLARSAAAAGKRVVLVDCDLRQRASSRALASNINVGLAEVVTGQATLQQALVQDRVPNLWLLPQKGGNIQLDLMDSSEMRKLISHLRDEFDFVVLDCAPVLPVAEARLAAAMADRVIMVVRWRKTPRRSVQAAVSQLNQVGARVAGAALTVVDLRALMRSGQGDTVYNRSFETYYR